MMEYYVLMSMLMAGNSAQNETKINNFTDLDKAKKFAFERKADYLSVKVFEGSFPSKKLIEYYLNGQLRNPDGTTKRQNAP